MGELTQVLSPTSRIQVDPGRIAAGIVTGIGFLGAGAIIRLGDLVRGLTTAGCIWFVAALGITIGQGMYFLAIVSTLFALSVLLALTQVERRIQPVVYRSIAVFAGFAQAVAIERRCQALLADRAIRVQDVLTRLSVAEDRAEITFKISARHHMQSGNILRAITTIEGVSEARWS